MLKDYVDDLVKDCNALAVELLHWHEQSKDFPAYAI